MASPSSPSAWPSDAAIYPVEEHSTTRTLLSILQASTNAHPSAPAIDNGTHSLTYAQLSTRIAARCTQLAAAGIAVGDRVGIRITSGTLDLYIGILAVLTIGAAYVPVDVDDPDERANLVWEEANVCAVLGDNDALTTHAPPVGGRTGEPGPDDDAWIIFTSGSTGKPKGVAVTHRSAAAFVDAESKIFVPEKPLGPGDRVLAGLSVAFDASCEEMWLAWRYAACLVPAPRSLVKAGADLGNFLTKQKITVVSTVPTLAALWPTETLKGVRLLILGGEACPPGLKDRLATHVQSVWNTYGPTEATVVACAAPLEAGKSVAIGLPLAGWKLAVVGEDERPVRWGEEGELVIGGVGMARYLDPEKDAVKFAPAPVFHGERAYRSGDLVRAEKDGLYFVGRNDEQIKLGGRRIELGEIDAAMMTLPGVKGAASAIRKSEMGNSILVGYVVREGKADPKERELLRGILPATLVPMLVTVEDLPVRTSGKVDRKALPWPPPAPPAGHEAAAPVDGTMAWIGEQWRKVLGVPATAQSNFFDLGGSSLGAAQLVTILRAECPTMSIADVYECATLEAMAERVDELMGTKQVERHVKPTPWYVLPIQMFILLIEMLFNSLRGLAVLALTKKAFEVRLGPDSWAGQHSLPWWLVVPGFVLFATFPGRVLTTAFFVRLSCIGIKPGAYQRGSATHIRMWAADRLVGMGGIGAIGGTQWMRYYARMIGCKVGKDAHIGGLPPCTGLARFGASCAIGHEADLNGWWLDGDILYVGTVSVGEGARIGGRAVLMPNTKVEPWGNVEPGVSVQGLVKGPDQLPPDEERNTLKGKSIFTDLRYTLSLLVLDIFPLLLIAPIYGLTPIIVHDYSDFYSLVLALIYFSLPGAFLGAFLYGAGVIVMVRFCSLFIRQGSHSWHSAAAWAGWLTHELLLNARNTLFMIYASLFTPRWLGMLGAKIGKNVETSTVVPIPSLLRVEDGAFLADDVSIAPVEMTPGRVWMGMSTVGKKAFVGNSGIVAPYVNVPENSLVGVLGTAPSDMEAGSSWLGRPAMPLPRKVENTAGAKNTFDPQKRMKFARGVVESCRLAPTIIGGVLLNLVGVGSLWFWDLYGLGYAILIASALGVVSGLTACLITIIAKWLFTPIVKPGQESPLWSNFVWRNELADTFVQSLAVPMMVRNLYGTELICVWLRCIGAKIGRGAWIESHFFPEAELCKVGAGATVNRRCVMQTHLFHDRVMRLDSVTLEKGATLGVQAIALPATIIGEGTTIAPMSLVMRGEHIPAHSRWQGNPVRPWTKEFEDSWSDDEKDKEETSESDSASTSEKSDV